MRERGTERQRSGEQRDEEDDVVADRMTQRHRRSSSMVSGVSLSDNVRLVCDVPQPRLACRRPCGGIRKRDNLHTWKRRAITKLTRPWTKTRGEGSKWLD